MAILNALFTYRDALEKRDQFDAALRKTPARQQFNALHKTLTAQQATVKRLTDEMEGRAQQVTRVNDSIKKLEEQLELEQDELNTMLGDEESTAEEMTELRGDIEKLLREINQTAREANKVIAELEAATEEYRKTATSFNANKKEYDNVRAACEKEKEDSAKEAAALDAEILALAEKVDPKLLERFKRARQHNAANPIVPVINAKCSGCNMSLPTSALKRLTQPDAYLECENCGRILYVELPGD